MVIEQLRRTVKVMRGQNKWSVRKVATMVGISPITLKIFLLGGGIGTETFEKIERFVQNHFEEEEKRRIEDGYR